MLVLVTRPRAQAEATTKRLRELGHEALIAPLMEIRFRDNILLNLDDVQGLLVTSTNGVQALARNTSVRDIPVYTVGAHTAQAAEQMGFTTVRSANGDAMALSVAVSKWANPDSGVLVHVSGDKIAGDLEGQLRAKGFRTRRKILYDAIAAEELPKQAVAALKDGSLNAMLLYSPDSAWIFCSCIAHASLERQCEDVLALCLSDAVARALDPLHFRVIRIAAQPNQDALLARLSA